MVNHSTSIYLAPGIVTTAENTAGGWNMWPQRQATRNLFYSLMVELTLQRADDIYLMNK
jgi:hypothetical protein